MVTNLHEAVFMASVSPYQRNPFPMIKIVEMAVNGIFAVAAFALLMAALRHPRAAFIEVPTVVFRIFLNVIRELFFIDFFVDLLFKMKSQKAGKRAGQSAAA